MPTACRFTMKPQAVFDSDVPQGGRSPTSFGILRDQDFRKRLSDLQVGRTGPECRT